MMMEYGGDLIKWRKTSSPHNGKFPLLQISLFLSNSHEPAIKFTLNTPTFVARYHSSTELMCCVYMAAVSALI